MLSKRERCRNWRLYVITDPSASRDRSVAETVRLALEGGASAVQLRDKEAGDEELIRIARSLLEITRPKGVPLIVNDRIRVARIAGADGVHLGQEDGRIAEARAELGPGAILGRSTHSREQALAAEAEGFDYIGVGPVFATPTKPRAVPVGLDLVTFASAYLKIPFVAIGGIDLHNLDAVLKAGARAVAVVRAVMSNENPKDTAQRFLARMVRKPKR